MGRRIYLDYAATTPVDPRVMRAMAPYWSRKFGNPGSVHWEGQQASAAVFAARQQVAQAIDADYKEVIFTGSATEANNFALRGISNFQFSISKQNLKSKSQKPKIIVSAIEHESVLETARDLEKEGVEAVYIPVSNQGVVDVKKIAAALDERTVLVSVMYANNEIGTIQPISAIAEIVREFRIKNLEFRDKKNPKSYILNPISYPLLHTDAVQALQYLDCNVDRLGIDLMTFSAHKIYGPKGVGALYVRQLNHKSYILRSIITGGGQEFGLRSGTENVPAIVGFGKAIEINESLKLKEFKRIKGLRDYFWREFQKVLPKAKLNGSATGRLPNNLNIYIPGSSAHDRCIELDLKGIAISPGVACSARKTEPSYVIAALGFGGDRPYSSIRVTFGRPTTLAEIKRALNVFRGLGL